MEKRFVLAIALSLLILVTWSRFTAKMYPVENKEVATKGTSPAALATASQASALWPVPALSKQMTTPEIQPEAASLFKYSTDKFEVIFIEPLGAIKEVIFKTNQNYQFPLNYGLFIEDKSLSFKKESVSSNTVVFTHTDQNKKITKKFIFSNSSYDIQLEIKIQNLSSGPLTTNPTLVLGRLNFSTNPEQARFLGLTIAKDEKMLHPDLRKDAIFTDIKFLGLVDRYFCAIVEPEKSVAYSVFIKKLDAQNSEIGLLAIKEFVLDPRQEIGYQFHIYLGPQELRIINSINPGWSGIIYYGTFDIISHLLLQILGFLYNLVHNWGLAVIILSTLIYFLFYPLTLKQMRSMKEMQALQPKITELKETCKDNPQKLNKEIMELYRKHKVNPLSGCLPLLLQMPIFFALYQALMRSISLRGAGFLWIKDLSKPDQLFNLPTSLPIMGNEINILPIIMAILMFFQQKASMATTASGSAEQQKMMMIIMPIMFGFIFYRMPSGLVLYWLVNSIFMTLYQFRINPRTNCEKPAVV